MKVVLLSPHPDDIAFSLGGWLAQRPFAAGSPRLVTVFSTSRYTTGALRDVATVTRLRRVEDEVYAAAHGLQLEHLGLPDSSVLGMTDDDQQTASMVDDPRRDETRAAVARAVRGADLVLGPLALGGHIDHRLVAAALRELHDERCAYYEDLPYGAVFALSEIAAAAEAALGAAPTATALPIDLASKRTAIAAFGSQLQASEVAAIEAHAQRLDPGGPVERLWHA
jgi:LmbE family N-acetylglucosaminyl deacetylase